MYSKKRMKQWAVVAIALCVTLSAVPSMAGSGIAAAAGTVVSAVGQHDFYDLEGHWAEKALRPLIEKKLLQGLKVDGVTVAMPEKSITRAELLAIIVRTFQLKLDPKNVVKLKDVGKGKWYSEAVDIGTSNKIINGFTDGTFKPNQPISNEHVGVILTNLKQSMDKKAGSSTAMDGQWYSKNIVSVLREKLGKMPEKAYTPKNNTTRAEALAALSRFEEMADGDYHIPSDPATSVPAGTPTPTPVVSADDPSSIIPEPPSPGPEPSPTPAITAVPGVQGYTITAAAGELVYFQVYAYGLTGLSGFDFKITYDPLKVVATAVKNGAIKTNDYMGNAGDIDLSGAAGGSISIRSTDAAPVAQRDGTLFTVVFRVQPGATGTAEINMAGSDSSTPKLFDGSGRLLSPFTSTNGKITIR